MVFEFLEAYQSIPFPAKWLFTIKNRLYSVYFSSVKQVKATINVRVRFLPLNLFAFSFTRRFNTTHALNFEFVKVDSMNFTSPYVVMHYDKLISSSNGNYRFFLNQRLFRVIHHVDRFKLLLLLLPDIYRVNMQSRRTGDNTIQLLSRVPIRGNPVHSHSVS